MGNLGVNATWGAEDWPAFVLEHLAEQSVLLQSGVRLVPIEGRVAHLPRMLTDGTASQVPPIEAPQALMLTQEPEANVARYDSLRSRQGGRHAS